MVFVSRNRYFSFSIFRQRTYVYLFPILMNSFLKNTLIFYALLSLLITLGAKTIASHHHSGHIYTAIETASNCPSCTTLILGDSTGEIYDRTPSNDSICIARTNRAITLTGQYLLLKKFIENSQSQNKLKVFLILHPKGLQASLDDQYSFNYFYQPFFLGYRQRRNST